MAEGVQTLIPSPDAFDGRMALVRRDVAVLLASGPVMVAVAPHVPRGTLDQGKLAHKLWAHIADWWNGRFPEQATSPETVKQEIKQEFGIITTEYSPLTGRRIARLKSWSEYSRQERCDLITATLAYMAENGCPDLPDIPATEYAQYREAVA